MRILIQTVLFFGLILLNAQENNNGITLGGHIPQQAENLPSGAKRMLLNKLGKIITDNGISDNVKNPRFILVPNISVLSKNITPTAPPKIAYSLEVTFYVGDGIAGNLFESETIIAKGVGTNELKAYTSAIRNIKTANPNLIRLIKNSKEEILAYYDEECSTLSKEASSLEAQGKTGEALATITSIPEASTCHDKNNQKIKRLYKKAIDEDCIRKLNKAKAIWAANQELDAASIAGAILASIEPQSACFSQVKAVYANISKRVLELTNRSWEYQLMELEINKNVIEAARDIGVAYGTNQAQNVTYNTRGWY